MQSHTYLNRSTMVRVASKALLLLSLLSNWHHVASLRTDGTRGLSFQHPTLPPRQDVYQQHSTQTHYSNSNRDKSEKSARGSGSLNDNEHAVVAWSKSSKSKSGKSAKKSGKSEKKHLYHKQNKYEVQFKVAVNHEGNSELQDSTSSKGSKKRPHIPKFEFIEVGQSPSKDSKSSNKRSKNGDGEGSGVVDSKIGKSSKDSGGNSKPTIKQPKSPTTSPSPMAPSASLAPASSPYTSIPTMVGSFGVKVPQYSLVYNLLKSDEPKAKELDELEAATTSYLDDFFVNEFDKDDFTVYETFVTVIVDTNSKGKVVVVGYDKSVARFDELSLISPTSQQLGSAVAEAFTGMEMIQYEDWLKEMLPSNNIFVGSKVQYLQDGQGVPDKSRRGIGATGIAASAVAFTLLVAGVVLYKSKSGDRESDSDKLRKSPGDMTVAGETFAGETYDGTASVSATSVDYARRYNDEENGTKKDGLGSIPEKPWGDGVSEGIDEETNYSTGISANNTRSAFRESVVSNPRTPSFEEVALQAPAYGSGFQHSVMPEPSSSEDDESQISDSELSQFVASTRQVGVRTSGDTNSFEIKSLLSMDSMDENTTGGLSVRDNSSRRLRTVAEIEALLSSELNDDNSSSPTSGTYLPQHQTAERFNRPRTVEEIESLLTAEDDETTDELPFSDEDESIVE
mmetsp:Transcript_12774/g.36072  ORF Transcript_12774/g.36072 Transcript_12774/m.36072 type:complete len:680 (-) Transcript_12774:284-2323(-)